MKGVAVNGMTLQNTDSDFGIKNYHLTIVRFRKRVKSKIGLL